MANPNDPTETQQLHEEHVALGKVKLVSLTASPLSIVPYGQSKISWRVTIPAGLGVDIKIFLDDESVAKTGDKQVSPFHTHAYTLKAKTELAEKELGKVTITVDMAACDVLESFVANGLEDKINEQLKGGSQIKLDKMALTFGNFVMNLSITLDIVVSHWFDAKMDVMLKYTLNRSLDGKVHCTLYDVLVDVSWQLRSHILSLGCTAAVQAALELQAKAFLQMMGAQIGAELASGLQAEHEARAGELTAQQHRTFLPYSMQVSAARGVLLVSCPT